MSNEVYNPSPPQEHISKEPKSRREILKTGAAAAIAAATGVLGARYGHKIESLPEEMRITGHNETPSRHERSEIPNSPLGAYQEGWRIIVPSNQTPHPEGYSAFIESHSNYLSKGDQRIEYSDGKFAEGTQTIPWNGEKHMLTLLPFHADKEDASAYITYAESTSGDLDAHQQTDKVTLNIVPFRDNVFLESEAPETHQDDLARLSLGAQTLDKLLPPVYLENEGKTQVFIPDVYKEVAMVFDKSYEDRSVRGVVLPQNKVPLFESDSTVEELFGELYFSAVGNPPDQPGQVDDHAVSAKDDFIEDLNRRVFQKEDKDPKLLELLSLKKYDENYKRYAPSDQPQNHAKVFGEMYATARLFGNDEMTSSHLANITPEERKIDLRTIWSNFERILTGAVGPTAVTDELPGLQKIHDAMLKKNNSGTPQQDNNLNSPDHSTEKLLP